jgi:hypothetical protein
MPATHPLARRRSIRLDDLRGHPVVLPTGPLPRTMDVDPGFAAFRAAARRSPRIAKPACVSV